MVAGGLLFYFSSFAAADAAETTPAAADAAAADALTTTAADAMTAAADANLTEKKGDGNVTQFFYIFFIFAKFAMIFLVPTLSNATSSIASLAIFLTLRIVPSPKILCFTFSPAEYVT